MALAEVQAFFEILSRVAEIVVSNSNAYYRASDDLQAFPHKVADLNLRQKDWEGLLQTHSLPLEDPVVGRLKRAKEMLVEELESFEKFQKANCCLRFYTKVTFPSGMIANLDDVNKAFDGILQGMKEKKEAEDLLTEAANKRFAPFSFLMDDKYVPIMETVNDIEAALASESPSGTVVLLHGESGRGKSTMAKYLALKFQEERKEGTGKFPGGIFFLACEKSTNTLLLMAKLWEDLGFGSPGFYPMNPNMSLHKQESDHEQMESQNFDNLRRRVMAELQMRDSQTMLIIIDNVSKQDVVNDMRIPFKHIKYLVTSQKPYQGNVTTRIRLAKPSMEEARQILRKHSGTWTEHTPLAPQVQIEVDELIKQADFNTLVLANLGAVIKNQASDSNSELEPGKLRELKEALYFLLNHVDEDTHLDATIFSGTYKQTIAASMTLIVDDILSEEARTMVYLMVMCEDLTVNEAIIKVWFHRIYDKSIGGGIKYSSALAQLKTQTVIVSESEDASWRQEPLMRWSIHELRRQFIREKKKEALEELMEKLMEGHSEEDDDNDLIAALCLLYGDATCCSKVQSASKLQVHPNFQKDGYDRFIKSFDLLLHPTAKDESQKLSHKSAKEVMLCALKYGKLEDEVISRLLRSSEVDLATCYALQSYSMKSSLLPKVVRILATKIASHLHVNLNSDTSKKLSMYLQAFSGFCHDQTLQIVPDLPETLCSLLQQSQDVKISTNLLRVLESLTFHSDKYTRRIASIPDLLETLVRFLDKDRYPDLFQLSTNNIYALVRHQRNHQIRVNVGAIPNALQNLIDLAPFTITAAYTLTYLPSTPSIAEKIASSPANLRSLLQLLGDDHSSELVRSVLNVFQTLLLTSSSRKSVCVCPEVLERFVEIINEDTFMKDHDRSLELWERPLSRGVAVAVRLITNCGKEFESFLSAGLGKYMTLLADGVIPTIQIRAVQALEYLGSESAICTTLRQLYPEVGAQLLKMMGEDADVVSFNCLTDAFHTIIVKQPEHGDWNCVNEAVIRYVTLLEVGKLQEGAARALSKLSLKLETCKLLDSSTVQKLVGLVREGTSSSTLKHVTCTLKSIWIKREAMSYTDVLISEALRRYVALLEDGVEQNLQSESARALGMFGYLTPHRELIIKYPGALQKLSGIIRVKGNPSILSNVACAVESITVRGTDLQGLVGNFFSTALERYVSLLVDGVEEELQEGAVRALGKLAFNETVRKLFCCVPNAVQCLLGRLKRSFVDGSQTLEELAIAIDKLLVSGKELEEPRRSTILSQVAERYIDLLGDEDQDAVQVQALRALTALCKTDDGRRCVFTLPRAVDRIVGLLDLNIHAVNPAILYSFGQFILVSTVGGTNLADEPMVTFLLDATKRLIKLVTQLDGAEWILTERILVALSSLAVYPTISKVIFSHPEVQVLLKELLVEDSTPPSIFVYAAQIAWSINLRRSDLDERITAEFLTRVVASYSSLQSNMYDVHSTQSHKQEAARILDELTSKPAIFDQAKISPMLVAWRVLGLLEKHRSNIIPPRLISEHLHLVTTSNMAVDYPDRESGGQSTTTWQVTLMSEAMKIYVSLLDNYNITDISRSQACESIALQLQPRSEHNPLLSECPSIEEKLLATFAWCEEASILEDTSRQSPSGRPSPKFRCTYDTINSLTLINPSSTDQIVLSSSAAYCGRGIAKASLGMYESALLDFDRALELSPNSALLLRRRAYIRAQLSDNSGASSDLHRAVNLQPDDYFCRCELGVLQRIMGNLGDALAHLDLAVDLSPPIGLFHPLGQRGYVKFLLGDEKGASVDAERAMLSKTVWRYLPVLTGKCFLTSSVRYLHFAA